MTQRSPDPAADRFLDKLLADATKARRRRAAEVAGETIENASAVPGLSEALAEVHTPDKLATLLDDPDPVAAIGKFLKDKTLRGV